MPITLDEPAQAVATVHMGNPPLDVTNAIATLQHQCAAWPKTPTNNPLAIMPGFEDAICQAVTGHALFVPEELVKWIMQVGSLLIAAFILVAIVIAGCVVALFRGWSRFFGPPKPAKPPTDALSSIVSVIGWFGWLAAAGLAAQYSLGLTLVLLIAVPLWTFLTPHMVSLLRNKAA